MKVKAISLMPWIVVMVALTLILFVMPSCSHSLDYTPPPRTTPTPVVYKLRQLALGAQETTTIGGSIHGSYFLGIGSTSGSVSGRTASETDYFFYTEDTNKAVRLHKESYNSVAFYEDGQETATFYPEGKVIEEYTDSWGDRYQAKVYWELHIPEGSILGDYNINVVSP